TRTDSQAHPWRESYFHGAYHGVSATQTRAACSGLGSITARRQTRPGAPQGQGRNDKELHHDSRCVWIGCVVHEFLLLLSGSVPRDRTCSRNAPRTFREWMTIHVRQSPPGKIKGGSAYRASRSRSHRAACRGARCRTTPV